MEKPYLSSEPAPATYSLSISYHSVNVLDREGILSLRLSGRKEVTSESTDRER